MKISDLCKILNATCDAEDCLLLGGIAYLQRHIKESCVFFAFKTWRIDTYAFIDYAINQKAAVIVTEKKIDNYPCIVVDNSYKAFMQFGEWYKNQLSMKVIGITGSIGKTSTKEMIFSVLKTGLLAEASKNNENSSDLAVMHIFDANTQTEVFIQEMAIHDIEYTTKSIHPYIAVITNIGYSHAESFGTRENICTEKLKIANGLEDDGILVLNADDDMLWNYAKHSGKNIITYGYKNNFADVCAKNIVYTGRGYQYDIYYKGEYIGAETNCQGIHNVYNSLAAFFIGRYLGLNNKDILEGIYNYKTEGYRQNVLELEKNTVIADCFNAAPDSMRSALNMLMDIDRTGKKIAVLADMLELGQYSQSFHKQLGEYINKLNLNEVILFGKEVEYTKEKITNPKIKVISTYQSKELIRLLNQIAKENAVILFKGSHGMGLEKIIDSVYDTHLSNPKVSRPYIWDRIMREVGIEKTKEYFDMRNIKNIAIYGLSINACNMIKFFQECGLEVKYVIDNRIKYTPDNLYNVKTVSESDSWEKADAIINSYSTNKKTIMKLLESKWNSTIINYNEIVNELLK